MDKIIIGAGFLLIAYALWQTIQKFRGRAKNSCCGTAEAVSVKKVEDTDPSHYPYRYLLQIENMKCSNCAKNVENILNGMPGVWGKVNLGKNEADVLSKEMVDEKTFQQAFKDSAYSMHSYKMLPVNK